MNGGVAFSTVDDDMVDEPALEAAAPRFFPCVALDTDQARDVSFGRALDVTLPGGGRPVALTAPDGTFVALYRAAEDGPPRAVPVAVFVP